MKKITRNDYEIINGKPYLGVYFFHHFNLDGNLYFSDQSKYEKYKNYLINELTEWSKRLTPKDCEIRYLEIIDKPPLPIHEVYHFGIIAIKFMIWGRAFKVRRLSKKGAVHYKKRRVNGRLKLRKA